MQWLRRIVAFVLAVVAASVLASVLSTHFVLQGLVGLGIEIGFGTRLHAYGHDVVAMGPLFGVVTTVAFLIAIPVAALAIRLAPSLRTMGYVAAGGVAIVVMLLAMQGAVAIMPVAGARTLTGLLAQALAGAAGGYVFAWLTRPRSE